LRPGLYEYQVASKMVEVHAIGGSEAEGYAPIVGAGPNSTALHYDKLSRRIEDGDIVVLDVGAQYSGYSADITRTLPANGKYTPRQREIYDIVLGAQNAALAALKPGMDFRSQYSGYSADITRTLPANGKYTPRQREIYDIVLGAQNAALAALKPGMDFCNKGDKSVHKIAYNYINSHGKDLHGKSLGPYFIHGLGHHIGLNVHDPGEFCAPFQPGMVITVETGIYIPEENLGVRIEDDVLITKSGHKLLSERLPRDPVEIEKIMAEAAWPRAKGEKREVRGSVSSVETLADNDVVRSLIEK